MGSIATTKSGGTCQAWADKYINIVGLPDDTMEEAANYCRNPEGDPGGPWCHTTDGGWEYCNVPYCDQQGKCKCKQNL